MLNVVIFVLFLVLVIVLFLNDNIIDKQCFSGRSNTNVYRGFAMLIIMVCHITGEWGFRPFTPLGGIGVAIFLFLSGFGLNESYKKAGFYNFWRKKLLRVLIPYALFRMVCVMVVGKVDWYTFLLDIIGYQSSYWYIDYIIRCYIVFWIAYRFFGKYKYVVLGAFSLYSFFLCGAIRSEQALSFMLGIICSDNVDRVNTWSKKTWVTLMMMMGVVGIGCLAIKQLPTIRDLFDSYYYYAVELGIKLPLGISMMIMIYLLPVRICKSQFLIFCGMYSLELYLVHMYIVPRMVGTYCSQAFAALIISGLIAYSFSIGTSIVLSNFSLTRHS